MPFSTGREMVEGPKGGKGGGLSWLMLPIIGLGYRPGTDVRGFGGASVGRQAADYSIHNQTFSF